MSADPTTKSVALATATVPTQRLKLAHYPKPNLRASRQRYLLAAHWSILPPAFSASHQERAAISPEQRR